MLKKQSITALQPCHATLHFDLGLQYHCFTGQSHSCYQGSTLRSYAGRLNKNAGNTMGANKHDNARHANNKNKAGR